MKKPKDEKLINEAIEFSKVIKSEQDEHVFKQHSDQNKIRCTEESLHITSKVAPIYEIGWLPNVKFTGSRFCNWVAPVL